MGTRSASLSFGSLVVLGALSATASCQQTPLPGTQLGTFKVSGTTTANSCGSGLGAPDPWVFDAQLSVSQGQLYWSFMDGTAPLSAPLTAGTTAALTNQLGADVDVDGGGCAMNRADAVDVTLSSASSPSSFIGTIGYTFTVPAGTACNDQLTSGGGEYAELPCSVTYKMNGARQ